ncbi:hypothetical protein fugu_015463 [Takifugu bimaculatus]|uniref:Uncharacterized protein n=1 Tax=Takifugu bimaculatus TaxID=433685 RepID=A0A4Z2BZH5_9TELE|nr:hypothetical protein fugu_015463 [Takifugu bimaculatus]
MASNIFAEPDDPHAHRRNNPPTGAPTGTLCGEPSAPLRRCQQPILFPKNPQPELTTIHNSGAALVWSQTKEPENGQQQANDDCPADAEQEDQQDKPQPSEPSEAANGATGGRRNPPGRKKDAHVWKGIGEPGDSSRPIDTPHSHWRRPESAALL